MSTHHPIDAIATVTGWSHAEIGRRLDLSRQAVSRIARAEIRPTPDTAWRIVVLAREQGIPCDLHHVLPPPEGVVA